MEQRAEREEIAVDPTAVIDAGRIINTHGVAGEVKIEVWLDSPALFRKFKRLLIRGQERKVISTREHKGFVLAKLEGVDDVNAAMELKEKTVQIFREDAGQVLPRGAVFLQDLLGVTVVDETGKNVGVLRDVFETPANTVYVVQGETEHLIPAVPEFILSATTEEIVVHLIEGM